jgi:hypothetical protein|tara:strand:+ start:206 stop:319 length:114 start_codon:yes stop_codon:yes gene_type:complete
VVKKSDEDDDEDDGPGDAAEGAKLQTSSLRSGSANRE